MATYGTYDFEDVIQNDTIKKRDFTITRTVDGVTTPVDLSSAKINIKFYSQDNYVLRLSSSGENPDISITNPENGEFTINPFYIPKSGDFNYDLQITFPDGTVSTWVRGTITVIEDYA